LYILTVTGYPRTFSGLATKIRQNNLPALVRHFLYSQQNFDSTLDPSEIPLESCPELWGTSRLSVVHSATATFCAPSNPSGIGGMYREIIRSTPLWKKGDVYAPRFDCVLIAKPNFELEDGMRGMSIARVLRFFSFYFEGVTYPCALIHWFATYGDTPDPDNGMWIVEPEYDGNGYRSVSVIHVDTIIRAAHLLPIFDSSPIERSVHYTKTLDAFRAFYVNKYADYHAYEIAF